MGSVVISGATSGAITLAVPAEAGTHTVTIPAATGQLLNSGDLSSAGDTSAGDAAAVGYTSAEGLILTGQGSTSDVTIKNDADATVLSIPTGTSNAFFKGNVYLTPTNGSTSTCSIELGANRTGNGYAYIDLAGDTTYSDFGLRILRGNSGANTASLISHRGTGNLELLCNEAAPMTFGTSGAERMRIDASGNLLVGTTSVVSVGAGAHALSLKSTGAATSWGVGPTSSFGNFYVKSGTSTGVGMTAAATSWSSDSDERQKTTLTPFVNAAQKISTLRAGIGRYLTDEENISRSFLIAQDVQAVLPEAVDVGEDEQQTLMLRYTDLIPLLVAAIQEQQETIEALEARITALEA